jgi:hypothetical protein
MLSLPSLTVVVLASLAILAVSLYLFPGLFHGYGLPV